MPCNDNTAPTGRGKTSWKHSANENLRTVCLHNPPDFLFPSVKEFSFLFLLGPCTWLAAAAAKSLQSCPTLSDPMDCRLPGSSIHGIFQARVLEWDATAFPGTWLAMIANFNSLLIPNKPTLAGEITGSVFFLPVSSVTQSCPTFCDPMDCSTSGFPVLHHLPEFAPGANRPSGRRCHPTIPSSVVPFSSCLQSFPASGSFPMSQSFAPGGQSIGASASVLPVNIRD